MMSKKTVFWVLAALAVAAGYYYNNRTLRDGGPYNPKKAERLQIVILPASDNSFWEIVIVGAKKAANDHNADVLVEFSEGGSEDQTTLLSKLDKKTIDGVAISPLAPDEQTRPISVLAMDVNVITLDNDAPNSLRQCYVGTNNYSGGKLLADLVRQALPEGGEIAIFAGDIHRQNARDRRDALVNDLLNRRYEDQPANEKLDEPIQAGKYTIVSTYSDGMDTDQARKNAEQALEEHPDLGCMVGLYSYNGPECLKAIDQAGKADTVKVVAFDESDATLAGIRNGRVIGTVVQDPYLYGYEAVRMLCDLSRKIITIDHMPIGGVRYFPCSIINKGNLDEYQSRLKSRRAQKAN